MLLKQIAILKAEYFFPIYFFAAGYTHVKVADSFWELVLSFYCVGSADLT